MKQVFRFDSQGKYIEPVIIFDGQEIPSDCTETELPVPNWEPVFKDGEWVETASEKVKNPPIVIVKTEMDVLREKNEDLNLQIITLWETLIEGGVL
jgi:hypothetical protein